MPTVRKLKDAKFIQTKYCPAAGQTNYPTSFDLEAVSGEGDPSLFDVEVVVAAAANSTNTAKYITATLYDSADDSTFAEVAPRIQCRVPGVAVTGSAETTFKFRLPPGIRRYIRCLQEVPDSGDNTGVLVTYSLLF